MRTRKLLRRKGTRQAISNQHLKDFLEKQRRETGSSTLSRRRVTQIVMADEREAARRLELAAAQGSLPAPERRGPSLPPDAGVGRLPRG